MRKFGILFVLLLASTAVFAENAREKEDYLPKAGEFGFSVSMNPLIQDLAYVFNSSVTSPSGALGGGLAYNPLGFSSPLVSISGKYLLTDNFALRMNVGWMYSNRSNNFFVRDDAAFIVDPLSQSKVVDNFTSNNAGASFMFGGEYRVGKGRVQGVFGGGLMYAFSVGSGKYSYGNAISSLNTNPSMESSFPVPDVKPGFYSQRYLSQYTEDPVHSFGLVLFAGVEWFVAPKISLGAEVNVSALYLWASECYYKAEGYNFTSGQVEEWTEVYSPRSSGFDFGTRNLGANLSLNFYF